MPRPGQRLQIEDLRRRSLRLQSHCDGVALATQTPGDCNQRVCDGSGNVADHADPTDVPIDGLECTQDLCLAGAPKNPPTTKGTKCSQGTGARCDGAGACVECLLDADCASLKCAANVCLAPTCNDMHAASPGFGFAKIAVDVSGNVVVAASFSVATDLGCGALNAPEGGGTFVAKFDASGNCVWSKAFDASGFNTLAVDAAGSIVLGGHFGAMGGPPPMQAGGGSVDFGGGALVSAGNADLFLAKLDTTGGHLWSKRFGGTDNEGGTVAIAIEPAGGVWMTGVIATAVDFGGGTLTPDAWGNVFVAKFDAAGAPLWSRRFAGTDVVQGATIAADHLGRAVVAGDFVGAIDLGLGPLASAGEGDIFVTKVGP